MSDNRGQDLVIKAIGTVSQKIVDGAYVLLQVKYGLIRLISTKADLCEQIQNVDMECPIEPGVLTITKSVSLPNEIPPVSSAASLAAFCFVGSSNVEDAGQIHRLR